MNKKKRNLIILLAATLALGLLLWLVIGSDDSQSDHTHIHDASEEGNAARSEGTLIDEQQEDLQSITFTNDKATYHVSVDTDAGQVVFRELKGFSVNDAFMEYVWYGVAQMTYKDIITSSEADGYHAKDYGLDAPLLTVEAAFAGNKTYRFIAGSNVPGEDEDVYYVQLDGDPHVYACAIDTPFFMGDSYYLSDDVFYDYDKDITNASDIKIGNITLSGEAFDGDFIMKVNRESDLSSPFYGFGYVVEEPIHWPVKTSASSMLVYDLTYLTADDVVMLHPTKKQRRQYGLTAPALTVDFVRNGKACTLYAGKISDNKMYVMLKGGEIIYQLDTESLSILHNLSPNELYDINAVSISMEAISGITVRANGINRRIEISRTKNENAMNENDVLYTYRAVADENEIKYSVYTNFVKQLNSAAIQRWNVQKPTGKQAEVTIQLAYFDNFGRESDSIRFYPYSDREYAVVWGDRPVNTVSASWLSQFLQSVQQL